MGRVFSVPGLHSVRRSSRRIRRRCSSRRSSATPGRGSPVLHPTPKHATYNIQRATTQVNNMTASARTPAAGGGGIPIQTKREMSITRNSLRVLFCLMCVRTNRVVCVRPSDPTNRERICAPCMPAWCARHAPKCIDSCSAIPLLANISVAERQLLHSLFQFRR